MYDNHPVEPPKTPEEGYHLTEDLVDKSIEFITDLRQIDPDKPFYLHLCFGATHAPHHVPKEWADKYAGRFDDGWDAYREKVFARQKALGILPADAELSRHDPDVPEWESLSPEARRLSARMMEVFAGFLSHTDHHLGRLLDFLREQGVLDDTIVMVISDNGASAEGGPTGTTNEAQFFNNAQESLEESLAVIDDIGGPDHFNHYPWGWTWAGNTPFRRWKRETYRGGSTDPFIVSWPSGIKARGQVRTQYAHIIDMVPTVLDLLGIEPPAAIRGVSQSPIQGVSFAEALDDPSTPSRHHTQYFEMLGHRAIYKDGWRAVCPWPGPSFAEAGTGFGNPISAEKLTELDATGWELYHIDKDPAENHDLAADHRDKLIELIGTWYVEAGKYGVMPVDGSGLQRMVAEKPLVSLPRDQYVYRPGTQSIPNFAAPRLFNRPTPSPPQSRSRRPAPRASCSARGPQPGATRSTSRTAGCTTSTTTWPGSDSRSHRQTRSRQVATSCASSSSRPASPTCRMAKASRRGSSCMSTAHWSPVPTRRSPRHSCSTRAGSAAAITRAPP